MALLPLLILAVSSAGQAPAPPTPGPGPVPRPAFPSRRGGRPFISPMGEPFRPEGRDQSGLALWFAQADRRILLLYVTPEGYVADGVAETTSR